MNRIIDIHSHILFGVDDGACNIEDSILTIEKMIKCGITDIILTPHYIEGSSFVANNKAKEKNFKELKALVKKKKIDINLYLGNEIFITNDIHKLIKEKEIMPLNKSKYILLEIPMVEEFKNTKNIIFELIDKGYKVILAHPERYKCFQKDIKEVISYIEMGVMLQGNIDSISGKNGYMAKRMFKKLLKKNFYSFIDSDIHHQDSVFFKQYDKNIRKIKKLIGKDKYLELVSINPLKIIEKD